MEKQLDQPGAARVTLENDMDYTDLIARLRRYGGLRREASDAIEALVKERDKCIIECNEFWGKKSDADYEQIQSLAAELAALRKQIDELQPIAWLYYERGEECFGHPDGYRPDDAVALYTLEGIKK